jgi:hypothetical protein
MLEVVGLQGFPWGTGIIDPVRAGSGVAGGRMKLQVQQQSLRVRVTEAELLELLSGKSLRLDVAFCGRSFVGLQVACGPETALEPGQDWRLRLSETALRIYGESLPSRDALVVELTGSGGEPLRLEFEVDVRDSVRVRGPTKRGGH